MATAPEVGGGSKGVVTGSAAAPPRPTPTATSSVAISRSHAGVVEDQNASWFQELRNYKLGSTVPVIRMMIQQSNCFVVVERGGALQSINTERALQQSGEMRGGSNFGKGQMVAADYTMTRASSSARTPAAWAVHSADSAVRWAWRVRLPAA